MNTSDYAVKVAKVVSDLTGIGEAEIMGKGRAAEIVDARWMVVKLVREAGYYPSQIAQVMGMTVIEDEVVGIKDTLGEMMSMLSSVLGQSKPKRKEE